MIKKLKKWWIRLKIKLHLQKIECMYCFQLLGVDVTFSSEKAFKEHMRKVHDIYILSAKELENTYTCEHCKKIRFKDEKCTCLEKTLPKLEIS